MRQSVLKYNMQGRLIDTARHFYPTGAEKLTLFYQHNADIPTDPPSILVMSYKDANGVEQIVDGKGTAVIDVFQDYEEGGIENYRRSGEWKGNFWGNRFSFTEEYRDGKLISGVSIDSIGTKYPYTRIYVEPTYPNGINALRRFVGENYNFPKEALDNHVSGTIITAFMIQTDGSISDLRVVQDLSYNTGQEAINVLKKAEKWTPGFQRGVPAKVRFTFPIALKLE